MSVLLAQTEKKIVVFNPVFGNSKLQIDSTYKLPDGDSIQIEALRFYISEIEFLQNGKKIWQEKNSYHLIDLAQKGSLTIALNLPTNIAFTQLKFNLGIDSLTNVSGAMGGDLDPTKGMYWAWQSGYINFKLEGKSNLCKTRNNEFQFHLGGYQYPFNNLQTIFIDVLPNHIIDLEIDIQKIINGINLSQQHHIMSPCVEAISLSETVVRSLSIKK